MYGPNIDLIHVLVDNVNHLFRQAMGEQQYSVTGLIQIEVYGPDIDLIHVLVDNGNHLFRQEMGEQQYSVTVT